MRCVNILSRLWHAPDADGGDGLLDDRLERGGDARRPGAQAALAAAARGRGQAGRQAEHRDGHQRPDLLGEVRELLGRRDAARADGGRPLHLSAEEAVELCDENTIGVVAILGSTFDGAYEPVEEICAALDDLQERTGLDIPVHVDGASGAFIAPFLDPDLEWDFRLPRVASINASGHKYGLVYPGVGWIVWRDADGAARGPDLLGQLPRRQHADVRAQLLAPGRPGRRAVLQLPAPRLRGLPAGAGLRARRRDAARRRRSRSSARSGC